MYAHIGRSTVVIHGEGREEEKGRKKRGWEEGGEKSKHTNLIILSILDGLWPMPDEQLECLQIVHHGRPVEGCASVIVCGRYVSTLLDEELEHVLVYDLDSGHQWSDTTVGLEVQISLGMVD